MDRREFLSGAALLTAAVAGCTRPIAEQSTPRATDTMPYNAVNGEGAQALHIETVLNWIRGDAVVSGCAPSDGVNAMEVDVASGTVRVDGSNVSVSAQTVTLLTGGTNPRKDLIWVDSTGTVQVSQGIEAPYLPSGKTGFNTHQPSPPDSTGVNGAVVAEVVVDAGASDIDGTPGQDLRDRRVLSSLDLDSLLAGSVETDELTIGGRGALDALYDTDLNIELSPPGASVQSAIDAVASTNMVNSGTVRLLPGVEEDVVSYSLSNDMLPIVVKTGVTLDMRGSNFNVDLAGSDLFELHTGASVLGHSATIRASSAGGAGFVIRGSDTGEQTRIFGYPRVSSGNFSEAYRLEADNAVNIYNAYIEGGLNAGAAVKLDTPSTNNVNNNTVKLLGASAPPAGRSVVELVGTGGGVMRNNHVEAVQLQIKSGDHVVDFQQNNMGPNYIRGEYIDPNNTTGPHAFFASGTGGHNVVEFGYRVPTFTNNTTSLQHCRRTGYSGWAPQNLAGKTGLYTGHLAQDDATNTSFNGVPCVWDGAAWQPLDGSAAFT